MAATILSSVQSLLAKLKAGTEADMTAEDLLLLSKSVQALADNEDFEQALIAVAEGHLDTATTAVTDATSAAENANTRLQQSADNLELIPQVETTLSESVTELKKAVKASLDSRVKTVFGLQPVEVPGTSGDNARSASIFAVYDASGDSYLVRPSNTWDSSNTEARRLEYLNLPASGETTTRIATHFVYTTSFEQNPQTAISYYGCSAILPLALKGDSTDIAYDIVYSSQNSTTTTVAAYAGVFCKTAGYSTVTKPKLDVNATDQWGIETNTSHVWSDTRVLYDNQKHCLLMVDFNAGVLVEKYRDGNVLTEISIPDASTLQSHVDNGDYTVVCFITNALGYPIGKGRYSAGDLRLNQSHVYDYYGYFGVVGDEVKMGSNNYSAHYRFTAEKKLEPVNYSFTSNVPYASTNAYITGEVSVALSDMAGNTLGVYQFTSSGDYPQKNAGYMASAILCLNPYSQTGILNEIVTVIGSTSYYGIGRTCKAY